jgi:hypothetical protein
VIIAALIALQGIGQTIVEIKNDNPETWTVEYPLLIQPQVADYRRCLVVTNRKISGKPDFEIQHTADLTRCAKRRDKAVAESNAALVGAKTTLSPAEVEALFDTIDRIHVARGRDQDNQFNMRIAAAEAASKTYQATRPKGLVIELRDASVVKARTDASAAAAAAQDKDGQ